MSIALPACSPATVPTPIMVLPFLRSLMTNTFFGFDRAVIALLAWSLTAAAPAASSPRTSACETPRRYVASLQRQDAEAAAALFADNAVLDNPLGVSLHGRDEIVAF